MYIILRLSDLYHIFQMEYEPSYTLKGNIIILYWPGQLIKVCNSNISGNNIINIKPFLSDTNLKQNFSVLFAEGCLIDTVKALSRL